MIEPAEAVEPNERPGAGVGNAGLSTVTPPRERMEAREHAPSLAVAVAGPSKPLLRGWIHFPAAVGALVLLALIVTHLPAISRPLERAALLVYGASLVELYAVSAAFHLGRWRGRVYRRMRLLDHGSIFVVIAATATVFVALAPASGIGLVLIGLNWAMAAAGIALKLLHGSMSRGLGTGMYVAMGWVAGGVWLTTGVTGAMPGLLGATLLPLALAGALYTAGALAYAHRWPDLWPRVFGYHEVFHALVVVGNALATLAVLHAAG